MDAFKKGFFYALGFIVLPVACALRAWGPSLSTVNPFGRLPREIDRWKWHWMQQVYGNAEDGVSGKFALIWYTYRSPSQTVNVRAPYMPTANPVWRALCWNFRNPIHNLNHPAA